MAVFICSLFFCYYNVMDSGIIRETAGLYSEGTLFAIECDSLKVTIQADG